METKKEKDVGIKLELIKLEVISSSYFKLVYKIKCDINSYFNHWESYIESKSHEDEKLYMSGSAQYSNYGIPCEEFYIKIHNDKTEYNATGEYNGELFVEFRLENVKKLFKAFKNLKKVLSDYKKWKKKIDKKIEEFPVEFTLKI